MGELVHWIADQACIHLPDLWVLSQGQGQMTLCKVKWHFPCGRWHDQDQFIWPWQWPLTLTLVIYFWRRFARKLAKTCSMYMPFWYIVDNIWTVNSNYISFIFVFQVQDKLNKRVKPTWRLWKWAVKKKVFIIFFYIFLFSPGSKLIFEV